MDLSSAHFLPIRGGARFLENGGYTKLYLRKLKQKLWYGFWFVMGVGATKITEKLIDIIFQQ